MASKNRIKADEARRLSEDSLRGPVIAPLLEIAFQRIKEAASKGAYTVNHPFYNAYPSPSPEAEASALAYLRTLGYTVKHHPNPDIMDPRSSDWDEVSW